MRKFRLLSTDDAYKPLQTGQVYRGNYYPLGWRSSVELNATINFGDWEEVFEEQNSPDPVNPQHYKNGEVECIEAIKSAVVGKDGFAGYLVGNLIKYVWRYESKNGIEDLEKGLWYLNKLIKHEKGKNDKGNIKV